ncbi:sugar kinase (plasmid) [Rhizobium sp. CB3090]|uniref:tagatose kinase n=1 Tax=Rhizobium sp. CB3090 TaxID=3039156 RepID=UPI0024B04937|nr:sugar kinase [Rhizobium sp. CB3090]WFU11758.1 sugar kinase [Rhizobium sp. CB3090]
MAKPAGRLAPETLGPTITVGEILVEVMATTTGFGFKEAQSLYGPFPSGAPAIFIDQVARLGGAAGIIASVGNDDFGALNVERLQNDGVDTSAISISTDRPTGSAFVRYRDDGSRDFIFNIMHSAAGSIELSPQAKALIARAGHVHVMGSAFAIPGAEVAIRTAIEAVHERGGSVSFDPNVRKELLGSGNLRQQFEYMLRNADLLLPSGEELFVAAGIEGEAAAVTHLHGLGIDEIVLKRGKDGATYFGAAGARYDFHGFVVEEVDPTGAGDAFGATYLTSRRQGLGPEASLERAAAAGARNVTLQGPMTGLPNIIELDAFIASTPRRTK